MFAHIGSGCAHRRLEAARALCREGYEPHRDATHFFMLGTMPSWTRSPYVREAEEGHPREPLFCGLAGCHMDLDVHGLLLFSSHFLSPSLCPALP